MTPQECIRNCVGEATFWTVVWGYKIYNQNQERRTEVEAQPARWAIEIRL